MTRSGFGELKKDTKLSCRKNGRYVADRMKRIRVRKGALSKHGGWVNGFIQPTGKIQKRRASKRARRLHVPDGNFYRKTYGWWEWC
jgi:hypothetical protein